MRLTTVGRRTGRERSLMVGYFEDGPNLVTMAMNGWAEGEPAWWLTLQSRRDARVPAFPTAGNRGRPTGDEAPPR